MLPRQRWQKYKLHRVQVQEEFANYDSDPAQIDLWLWHGSASVQEECRTGFDTAYANAVGHFCVGSARH